MLLLFLVARLVFIPLASSRFSAEQVASLKGLGLKVEIQAVALLITAVINLTVFVMMGDESGKGNYKTMITIFLLSISTIIILTLSELISIIVEIKRRRCHNQARTVDEIITKISKGVLKGGPFEIT